MSSGAVSIVSATAFFQDDVLGLTSAFLILGALLRLASPADGRAIRNAGIFFLVCVMAAASALLAEHFAVPWLSRVLIEIGVAGTGLAIIRLAGLLLFHGVLPRLGLRPPGIVGDLMLVLAYFAWAVVRLRMNGVEPTGILTTSAIVTGVIAFSLQESLGNIFGGLVLQFDRSVKLGDWIRIDDVSGRVVQIHWRHTTLVTRNGERVVLPNSYLMKTKFMVQGVEEGDSIRWRRVLPLTAGYEVVPGKFIALVETAVKSAGIPHVLMVPEPSCVLMNFGDGFISYHLRYWLDDPQKDDATDSLVRQFVYAAMLRAGMQVPMTHQYVLLESLDEAHKNAQAGSEMERRRKALRSVDLFASLNDEEIAVLAPQLVVSPFARDEVITRQGAEAHWLYLLVDGEAEVWLESEGQASRLVNTLHQGDFFGERALMTGERRSATVKARTPVLCYRLDKGAFAEVIASRPAIAEEISVILASRVRGLDAVATTGVDAQSAQKHMSEKFLHSIRRFFRLDAQ